MIRSTFSVLTACTLLAGGCSLAPDYTRPQMPVAEEWPAFGRTEDAADAVPASEIPWKRFFGSPTLQGYIAKALEHNRDLQVATLNIEKARALYRVERAGYFPKINADFSATRTGTPENANSYGGTDIGQRFTQSSYQANLAVTAWELDLFGRVRSLNEAALQDYFASGSARDAARISLIAETANAYLQWLADEKALEFVNDTLEAQEKSFALIERSYQQGIRSKLEVAQARSTVESAKASQAAYMRAVAQDKNALALLIGESGADALKTSETLDDIRMDEALPANLPASVLLQRPDIMQAEHTLLSENANIGAARAAFFPSISLTAAFGFSSVDLSNLFENGSSRAWNFAPKASLPLFKGGENIANLDSAKVSKKIAVAQYEKAIQTAFREVADELAARKTLTRQLEAQTALVKATGQAYDLSYARYKAGTDNYLTALESQRELFQAQQNAIDVQRLQLANLVNLYKVLGGGLANGPEETQDGGAEPAAPAGTSAQDTLAQAKRP